MRRSLLIFLASLALAGGVSVSAQAHVADTLMWRPYVIQQLCKDDGKRCKTRMYYAPGQNPGTAKHGTYFYQKARLSRHDDFRLTWDGRKIPSQHSHKKSFSLFGLKLGTGHGHNSCRNTGWGFDHRTGTWAPIPKKAACLKSYNTP
jgi:hypothetical protein